MFYRRSDIVPSEVLPVVYEKVRNAQFKPTIATSILLQMFSKDGDAILDPFTGFGSIPLVCEWFGRRWMAFEIDKRKYSIAIKFIREKRAGRIELPSYKGNKQIEYQPELELDSK